MIIMSVDLGNARTGVAVSDKSETFAFEKGIIKERNNDRLVQKLTEKAAELGAEMLVIGLPKNMDGSLGFRAEECTATAKKIEEKTGLPIVMWDERCTTMLSSTILDMNSMYGKKRKENIDAVAAVMILESYLNYRKNNK